ncbi:hypothetical protein [Roseibium sp.]|uniref:hypothetical protein n=1 Tax=Roseibium sp. TaxID=1936156 RepID=UPI003A979B4C
MKSPSLKGPQHKEMPPSDQSMRRSLAGTGLKSIQPLLEPERCDAFRKTDYFPDGSFLFPLSLCNDILNELSHSSLLSSNGS